MSCSISSTAAAYHSPPHPVRVLARGDDSVYGPEHDLSYQANETFKDHWKHSHPHTESPNSHISQQHPRTRHTHSQVRTQFDYNPRTRYDPSSLPSSPLSMSGVYNTPPSSAHLPSSPFYPVSRTSPIPSLTSSGVYGGPPSAYHREQPRSLTSSGVFGPPSSYHREQPQSLTSSGVFGGPPLTYHREQPRSLTSSGVFGPPSSYHREQPQSLTSSGVYGCPSSVHQREQLTSSYPSLSSSETLPPLLASSNDLYAGSREHMNHHTTRPYVTTPHHLSDIPRDPHHSSYDWRSESWSAPATTSRHPTGISTSPHPLNHKTSSIPHSSTNSISHKSDLPSPSHSDSSPPTSVMVSPRHMSGSQSSLYASSSFLDIVCHPHDAYIELGDQIFLHCQARILYSSEKPIYQWYKDEEPLIGEVDTTLKLPKTSKEDLGYYFCVVSNTTGDFRRKSSTACVRLFHGSNPVDDCKPVILSQPDSTVIVALGESLVLKLIVKAQPRPTFQWYKNGNELPSANENDFCISYVTASDEGQYICSIKNELGAILSDTYGVYVTRRKDTMERIDSPNSVCEPSHMPQIHMPNSPNPWRPLSPKKHSRSQNNITEEVLQFVTSQVCRQIGSGENIEGVRLALGISQSDSDAVRLQHSSLADKVRELINIWMRTVPQCSVALLEDALQVYGFRVSVPTVAVSMGCEQSLAPNAPVITSHPESVRVNAGEVVEMEIQAEGTNLTYQWYKDNLPYPGLTRPKITLTDVQEPSTGLYYCCVKNSHGSVNSRPAKVDIVPMKLKLPPSLQGTTPPYCGNATGIFSPPPNVRTRTSDDAPDPEIVIPERKLELRIENNDHRPIFLEHPISQSLSLGEVLNLKIVCKGAGRLRYSWYFNGLAMPNEKQSEFTLYCFTEDDVGDYSCEVTNEFGSVMSDKAVITLLPDNDNDEDHKF